MRSYPCFSVYMLVMKLLASEAGCAARVAKESTAMRIRFS